jgi:Xaa-Pro aminopeptidase
VLETAELVDAGPALAAARATKVIDEITCISIASAMNESAFSAMESTLMPGVSEKDLLGVHCASVSHLGSPTPGSESVAFATPTSGPVSFRYLASHRPIGDGELVVLAPSALYAGYEAAFARTCCAGHTPPPGADDLAQRSRLGLQALVAACRPGNSGADLYSAWDVTGAPLPEVVLAHGLGIGAEPPIVGLGLGAEAQFHEDMVLMVQSWLVEEGTGGWLERATVRITTDGPVLLSPPLPELD